MAGHRIAVVRLDSLGDHVLGSGLLAALRTCHQDSRITLVIPAGLADLYSRCPTVDDLRPIAYWGHDLRDRGRLDQVVRDLSSLGPFDLVINPRFAEDYYRAGILCGAMAGANARSVAFRQSHSPYTDYNPNTFYSELVDATPSHHVSRYAAIMTSYLGASGSAEPTVWYSDDDLSATQQRYALGAEPYVVVGLGASEPYKVPATSTYVHLLDRLTDAWDRRVLLIGLRTERPLHAAVLAAVRRRERIVSSLGELQLFELAALLSAAELYVGPDAGPMHMAAAAGAPVIELAWVPADYPQTSRGARTAGRCWSPWTSRAITVHPPGALFEERIQRREHIQGIAPADIDAALAEMLVPRQDHSGPRRRSGRGRLLPSLARWLNAARRRS